MSYKYPLEAPRNLGTRKVTCDASGMYTIWFADISRTARRSSGTSQKVGVVIDDPDNWFGPGSYAIFEVPELGGFFKVSWLDSRVTVD